LTTIEPCKVPCYTLRNAIKAKKRADYLDSQIVIIRDSIKLYNQILSSKDSLIFFKDTQLTLLRSNESHYKKTIEIQEEVIEEARFDKVVAYILSGASFLIALAAIL
jgi:hypothetical protein